MLVTVQKVEVEDLVEDTLVAEDTVEATVVAAVGVEEDKRVTPAVATDTCPATVPTDKGATTVGMDNSIFVPQLTGNQAVKTDILAVTARARLVQNASATNVSSQATFRPLAPTRLSAVTWVTMSWMEAIHRLVAYAKPEPHRRAVQRGWVLLLCMRFCHLRSQDTTVCGRPHHSFDIGLCLGE